MKLRHSCCCMRHTGRVSDTQVVSPFAEVSWAQHRCSLRPSARCCCATAYRSRSVSWLSLPGTCWVYSPWVAR